MFYHRIAVIFLLSLASSYGWKNAFDIELYEEVLDAEQCELQLSALLEDDLRMLFIDYSAKLPHAITSGNVNAFGEYYKCLEIDEVVDGMRIEGKYAAIMITDIETPEIPEIPEIPNITWPPFFNFTIPVPETTTESEPETEENVDELESEEVVDLNFKHKANYESLLHEQKYNRHIRDATMDIAVQRWAQTMAGVEPSQLSTQNNRTRIFPIMLNYQIGTVAGFCVPKVCTITQAFAAIQEQQNIVNVTFNEYYYRLPNDKPLAPADYVAFALFGLIIFFVIMSTSYDVYQKLVIKKVPNKNLCCFSVYTNTQRFLTFNTIPNSLECVDGIRAISMLWVVVGHTYSMTLLGFLQNTPEALQWMRKFTSTWINSAPLTVDTFFLLSGILAVYSTVGKISKARFLRSIHLFYINRFLRMFPLLATVILLQASIFNYVSDGPFWQNIAISAENCRQYWWSALLHVQNYVNPVNVCLAQTWYLSVDTQLYLVSPLILVWMFGNKTLAWISLIGILLLSLISTSVYSFTYNFTAALLQPNRLNEFSDYIRIYYLNTLTRAPPFFIGMIFGYLLHQYRGQKARISKIMVAIFWFSTCVFMSFCVFSIYPVMQLEWSTQMFDNFLNAYMRSLWALSVGWIIFACVHGYGGPVNWILSLQMWKLPARLSFAMYLIHFPIIMIANASWTEPHYFRNGDNIYRFMADLLLTFIAAFILCILIDAPFSTLQKLLMNRGKRPRPVQAKTESKENIVEPEPVHYVEKTSL